MTTTATTTTSSSKPNFSATEIKHRESALLRCFQLVNTSGNGLISATELEAVAKMFNPQAGDFQQETKIILNKLDLNHDNVIDSKEWVSGLFDLFRFMTEGAFNKHIDELVMYVTRGRSRGSSTEVRQTPGITA